jgi:hypothetical protein
MRRITLMTAVVVFVFGALTLMSPAPQAGAPCLDCPDIPIPSECPTCYQWAPQTCRQCGHCERIKGCRT